MSIVLTRATTFFDNTTQYVANFDKKKNYFKLKNIATQYSTRNCGKILRKITDLFFHVRNI